MDESINTANKKQSRQKPPLSVLRIAGEILAARQGVQNSFCTPWINIYDASLANKRRAKCLY